MVSATVYAVGNVASSVALVLLNKKVFAGGFAFPMTLSFFHFCFTVIWYELLAAFGAYSKPTNYISTVEKFKIAAAGFASIGFMNLSLNTNSVGFYQITKLTIIPVTLLINALVYSVYTTSKIKLSLFVLLFGVGIATVTDVELRPLGFCFGLAAVLTTAVFQIWQGTKQKELGVSATQLQATIAMWQSAQALAVAGVTENSCYDEQVPCSTALSFFQEALLSGEGDDALQKQRTLGMVLGTCCLALMVNLCSFGLIGRTSPITFQVVGHAKTCLVLTGGYLFFSSRQVDQQLYNNIAGVVVAMFGVILYGHIKHAAGANRADCLDSCCPSCVLMGLDAKDGGVEEERIELTSPSKSPGGT